MWYILLQQEKPRSIRGRWARGAGEGLPRLGRGGRVWPPCGADWGWAGDRSHTRGWDHRPWPRPTPDAGWGLLRWFLTRPQQSRSLSRALGPVLALLAATGHPASVLPPLSGPSRPSVIGVKTGHRQAHTWLAQGQGHQPCPRSPPEALWRALTRLHAPHPGTPATDPFTHPTRVREQLRRATQGLDAELTNTNKTEKPSSRGVPCAGGPLPFCPHPWGACGCL